MWNVCINASDKIKISEGKSNKLWCVVDLKEEKIGNRMREMIGGIIAD